MRLWLGFLLVAFMGVSACAQDDNIASGDNILVNEADVEVIELESPKQKPQRKDIPTVADVLHYIREHHVNCKGVAEQGGVVICQTEPFKKVKISRAKDDYFYETADINGQLIIGFDRDELPTTIRIDNYGVTFQLDPREYDISRIDGLPPSQVSSFNDEQLKKIRSSTTRKKKGFASRAKTIGLKDGFIYPLKEVRKTSPFGAQRILNGEAKRPHYGVDIAAPVGTPIYAPADGIVSLADDDLYFEGAMVMLDHGQGLNSMYLHVSEIFVEPGQAVKQGEKIAAVGSRGRSTGPHLCWRLKWRNRNLDPELLTKWPDADHDASHSEDHSHQ